MSHLQARFPDLDLEQVRLGTGPTPVTRLPRLGVPGIDDAEVWVKDESRYGDGAWGGNKVRKLEWIIPEARRRHVRTLFTVGGIGTHWGLACARYGADHGLRTVLGLVDQPVDDHVREQLARLEASGADLHRFATARRLRIAAPWLMVRHARGGRLPWYLPAGGSNAFGALGYVEAALELADQVQRGELPEPATVVVPIGSGGTAAGLVLGLRLAGLRSRVLGVVVNDAFPLDAPVIARLATRTADLLARRGATGLPAISVDDLTTRADWLGETYGDPTPASRRMVEAGTRVGLLVEPVYTGKALAAIADLADRLPGPVLWLATHGPR
ncbi:1-aminocyclopropane-1-carboxylate deaminase/D-cysteine desulfhydrase [Nocardioides pocheonensis]|uniref:Pyridoxal-phosphate dependent enzyme n=1 Tax=Nocardioides pocheonensis TaxID=661485 RepID=A0A3N0GJE5_9ACTN|nr:pyridoxal-phosphate dependent enzyme [Nocardioides pocheonensis]RNM12573.1 pyridoxal-phosphate dependent enzyme [Nocardioides pocheonensis]